MSINCEYKDLEWSECPFECVEDTQCTVDMIVPDAKSDIAKVTDVTASVCIFSCEVSSGRISVSGEVTFNLLYIGDEENTKINSVTKTAPFTHICVPPSAESVSCLASARIKSCDFSLANSRRLKAASVVTLSVRAFASMHKRAPVKLDGAEITTRTLSLSAARVVAAKEISVNDTLELPSEKGVICELLRSRAAVTHSETKILNNKLFVKGKALISLLYNSEVSVCDASVELEFTEVIQCDCISSSLDASVSVSVASCDVTPDSNLSGDCRMINASLVLSCSVLAWKKEEVSVITDAYLPHGALKCDFAKMRPAALSEESCEEDVLHCSLTLSNHPPVLRVVDLTACVSESSLDENGVVSGFIEATAHYISTDPSNPVASYSGKIPFTHMTASPCAGANAFVKSVSYSITSSDEIELRINLSVSLSEPSEEIMFITSAEEIKYTPPERASVIIAFIGEGDTLRSVAKKHNISLAELTAANALEQDAILQKGAKLIIPR